MDWHWGHVSGHVSVHQNREGGRGTVERKLAHISGPDRYNGWPPFATSVAWEPPCDEHTAAREAKLIPVP